MTNKINDPTIPTRIDNLLKNGTPFNDWESKFLNSIADTYKKYSNLSEGQYNTLVSLEKRYGPEEMEARREWYKTWDDDKNERFRKVIEYYKGTSYYQGIVERAKDTNYIPTQKEYEAVTKNKYAERLLKELAAGPKFAVAELVVVRYYGEHRLGLVTYVSNKCDWTKGSRWYTVDIVGGVSGVNTVEKDIRRYSERYDKTLVTGDKQY